MTEERDSQMNLRLASTLRPLLTIVVFLLVVISLYFVVRALPFDVLGDVRPKRVAWWSLPLIALLQIVFLFLAAEIWRRVVRLMTGTQITLWSSYLQLAVVAVGKYVPGKVWGFVARAGEMYRLQIPVHLSVMSSVVEQMLLMTGALLIAIVAALIALPEYWIAIIVVGVFLLLAAIVASTRIPALTRWLLRRRDIKDIPEKIPGYHAKGVFRFTLAYAMLWVLSGLIFSIIYFSLFDASITRESVAALTLANTTGIVLGFFAFFVPGGIGVREAVTTFVLAGFIPVREALLAAVCYRAWMILIDGLNALLILGREASMAKRK
jgi:uncharacterized membrane protein YbhN (UPF0104 family)